MYVEMNRIIKRYGSFSAVDDACLNVERGSLAALLGPSGSGKTTLLRILAGLETPDAGEIKIDGKVVNALPPAQRGIGFVFQNYALFRYMTVRDNIAFGLKVKKAPKAEIRKRVSELIELTGLQGLEKRYPNQLSGGQCQRVAFARALAPNPDILLLDEPFAAIDAKVRKELRAWLKDMIHKVGVTAIFVTHDQDEAVEIADRIIIANRGRVEQIGGPVEIYKSPATPFVAQFVGAGSLLDNYERLSGFEKIEGATQAVVRPEFVEAVKSDNRKFESVLQYAQEGTISEIAFRGGFLEVTFDVQGMKLKANRSLERRPIAVGEKMCVLVYRLYVFDDKRAYLLENSNLKGKVLEG